MKSRTNQQAFFTLLQAGLFGKEARLSQFNGIDYAAIMQLAEEQSVVGLVTAGLARVTDVEVSKDVLLQLIGYTLQIEQQNKAMNKFVSVLIEKLRIKEVDAILVKGQGIAQCYENPLWRSSGDVDLLLSDNNYKIAKEILVPIAVDVEKEFKTLKHIGMTMPEGFVVELHGTLHSHLSRRIDKVIDSAQHDIFDGGNIRFWTNNKTTVFLPSPDSDIVFIFTHILQHFYFEGIGLRQVCDWCRLLWTYKDSLSIGLLEFRIKKMRLMSEWKSFASFAVNYLGMPAEAMTLYDSSKNWRRKADHLQSLFLEHGEYVQNRERYISKNYIHSKILSIRRKAKIFCCHLKVFPLDSLHFFIYSIGIGIGNTIKGE